MNKQELLEEIKRLREENERLESELIDFKLPKNYNDMSDDEKKAYHKKQEELKKNALKDMENFSQVKNTEAKFSYPKSKLSAFKFSKEVGKLKTIKIERNNFKKSIPDEYKEFHKQQLEDTEKLIERYNSTKAMRNDKIEFGVNFENFAKTYFLPHAVKTMVSQANRKFLKKYSGYNDKNANPIAEGYKFQSLTEEQQKDLIKIRINLFSNKLNKLLVVAQTKINNDNKPNPQTYLEKNGFLSNQVAYRDASKKFTKKTSIINKGAVDMARTKQRKSGIKTGSFRDNKDRYASAQHDLIEWGLTREKFETFSKNFKGNGRQFSVEFQQNFPKLAKKTYLKSDGARNAASISSLNLASSPISVQQHEITKKLEEEVQKATARMQYVSDFIPATESHSAVYLGRNFSNAKSKTERELDKARAREYKKELKNIAMRKDLIGYETIFDGLNGQIKTEFNKYKDKHLKNFDALSNSKKIAELQSFIAEKAEKFEQVVHSNAFFSTSPDKLLKLNGVMLNKGDAVSKETKNFIANLSPSDAEFYKGLVQTIKECKAKIASEKADIEKLGTDLEALSFEKFSYENSQKMKKITEKMQSHTIKLKLASTSLETAEEKKRNFEKSFAAAQIKQALSENKTLHYNKSISVFEKYVFPATDAFGETYNIEEGTIEAKQIQKIINAFIMKFKNQIQSMKLSFETLSEKEVSNYADKLFDTLSDDFGMNIRDIKKTQKYLAGRYKTAEGANQDKIAVEIDNYLQKLKNIESELIKKLKMMNVDIGNVTTKKK